MKVLFHTHTLNFRGTAVAVYDYAKYNQEILGNESVICYNASVPQEVDVSTESAVVELFKKEFQVVSYTNDKELQTLCDSVDVAYFIRYGHKESLPNVRTAVHAVFQAYEPHGDRYAYVSEWLSNKMGHDTPFVPHIVTLPDPIEDFRQKLNIPKDKMIIGRIGGYMTFDLPFVKQQLTEFLDKNDDYVFLMANTEPFIKHPSVRYINSIVDRQKKSNFINTCDAMLHARQRGESFGLSICEFLFHNKPVLAWEGGVDQNHVHLLKKTGLLYNEDNFIDKLQNINSYPNDFKSIVKQFEPEAVMKKFNEVFLR
jgi:hypothetical protein